MIGHGGGTRAEAWMKRIDHSGSARDRTRTGDELTQTALPDDAGRGWDPFDVWLRRVELPRRRHDLTRDRSRK